MCRKLAFLCSIAALIGILSSHAVAQDYQFTWDGDVDSDWMTTENWIDSTTGLDPSFPPTPTLFTRVHIIVAPGSPIPEIGPGDAAQAYGVRIGRHQGPGELTMTGGTLDLDDRCSTSPFNCDSRLRVGNDDTTFLNPGTFNLSGGTVTTDTLWIGSGSHGEMNMSGGVVNTRGDFYLDWTNDQSSVLNMTGGTINILTQFAVKKSLRLHRNSALNLDGGEILIDGKAELGVLLINPQNAQGGQQTPNVTVSITAGLLQAGDYLQIGGSVVLDGGILRARSFNEALSVGTVEINGSGLLHLNNSQESVAAVQGLITSGFFTTSEASPLVVEIVNVGGTNFTQVSVSALGVPGDYNENGIVDAADYTVWRDTLGSTADLRANGNNTGGSLGIIDQADYNFWKAAFGNPPGSGSGSTAAVPEPAAFVYGLMALAGAALMRRPA